MISLRTWLVLGRVSNLPTVWSNCLAGWLLGGAGEWGQFFWLGTGATLLYLGGMFLNDAFDEQFDRRYRSERPIPTGAATSDTVWHLGVAQLVAGCFCLALIGPFPAALGVLLALNILIYDAVHKRTILSPLLMAGCRVLLVLIAGASAQDGVSGMVVWAAVVLGGYIVGLTYVAKFESAPGAMRYWPCLLLAAPLVLAYAANAGPYQLKALCLALVLAAWVSRCLMFTFVPARKNLGRTVSGLLAGIVLVDLLALAGEPMPVVLIFPLLFLGALLAQRYVPAT